MKDHIILSALAILALAGCRKSAQDIPQYIQDDSVIISEQLSNKKVTAFAEDRLGHIWMATGRGLNRFDGHKFRQYFCTDDTLGLPDNQINVLHTAADGVLWVASVNGVARYTPEGNFQRVQIHSRNRNISQIFETADGKMLFSNGTSLFMYIRESDVISPIISEFNSFGAPHAVLTKDKKLWVISDQGFSINCYGSDFKLEHSLRNGFRAYHICDARNGEIWLSGMGELGILDSRTLKWKDIPACIKAEKRIIEGDVDIIYAIDEHSLLLNVIGKGFFYYYRTREKVSFEKDADFPFEVPQSEVRTIFRDSRRNLWFGTTDQAYSVSYQYKSQFNGNKMLSSLFKTKSVTSLSTDKAGNLWITTLKDGLWCYHISSKRICKVGITHLIKDAGVGYIRTSKVFCDSEGYLWIILSEKMLAIKCSWDGSRLSKQDELYVQSPISIAEDDLGRIWFGCMNSSLVRYDKKKRSITTVNLADDSEWTFVPSLLMRDPGRLIAGCFNRPSAEINTYTLEVKPIAISEEEKAECIKRSLIIPNCIFKDSADDIWIGTFMNGLLRRSHIDGKLRPVPGAPCLDICSMEEDRHGNIWISTMFGLGKYDRTVGKIFHYFEADGIGGSQFLDRSSCRLGDGTLIFGGTHGITWFNPLDVPAKRSIPLVFENLSIHNQSIRPAADGPISKELCQKPDIRLNDSQNGFSIYFAALDYSEFEQTRYAFMMEGFDKYWVEAGTGHEAYYANLPAGKYRFRVRISNGSHNIVETEDFLNIQILPPWYSSWWGILIWITLGLVFMGVMYIFIRRIRRVRKEAARRIREVRREQEKAREAERAEKELNKIQMNYFSNVAHEFRTPLTMIAGPAQQLSESAEIHGADKKLVDIIKRNAIWMLSLVNQLLDFNRLGKGKIHTSVAKIDIVGPLKDTAELFRFNAQSKGIEILTHGLEEPFNMWVDADKVQKVVMNLLSNALKFTPYGGRVSLSFDVISRAEAAEKFPLTESDTDGQYACISVSDTGCGIPEEHLEKIFERFYQSESGINFAGSGIGLSYARALSTMHHGYIKAWNRDNESGGAIFSMIIPVSAASYTEEERSDRAPLPEIHDFAQSMAADTSEQDEDKKHISIVDDDIDIANYLKIILRPYYKVSLYFEASSALKGMAEDEPDLIISDVVMPGMNGYKLCEHIKNDIQLSHIPVVLVTAKVAVDNQVQGLAKGADAYVTKPFQPSYLLALVKSLLDNREKLRQLLGNATTTEEISREELSPRDAAFMKDLYELMEKELSNADLDIIQIAEMMKLSRTKFYYKLKGLTGENPSVFFKRYKLNRAADLLKEGRNNMSEIAWMTGFSTLSHFSTSFKKQFGVPPSEYNG